MDRAEIDAVGRGKLFWGKADVRFCHKVDGQDNVHL